MTRAHSGPLTIVLRGALAQNRARTVLSVLAIALGVALGYAVQLINAAAVGELAQGVKTLSGDADLQVRGPRGGFPEAIYPALARMADVAVASGRHHEWQARSSILKPPGMNRIAVSCVTLKPARSSISRSARRE